MPMPGSPLVYDALSVFITVFSNPDLAAHVADTLTCNEVNVLVGLLESGNKPDAAALWLAHHLADCDDLPRHLH